MKIQKYSNYITEKLDFKDIKQKIGNTYPELKTGIVEMIESTLKSTKEAEITMIDLEDFINDYISTGKDANMINKLIEDTDIFNFYLKYQTDVDEILNDKKYMDESPRSHDVFSLYDVIIDGTKQSILESLKIIRKELFKK